MKKIFANITNIFKTKSLGYLNRNKTIAEENTNHKSLKECL